MFYVLERAKCKNDTDKHIEHILDYCKKYYQKAYKEQNGIEPTFNEIQPKQKIFEKMISHF